MSTPISRGLGEASDPPGDLPVVEPELGADPTLRPALFPRLLRLAADLQEAEGRRPLHAENTGSLVLHPRASRPVPLSPSLPAS